MAIRYSVAVAAALAGEFVNLSSLDVDRKEYVMKHWRDCSDRFPIASSWLLQIATQSPSGLQLLKFVHWYNSMRKLDAAIKNNEDYSLLPLKEEKEEKEVSLEQEETAHEADVSSQNGEKPKVSRRGRKKAVEKSAQLNIDDMLATEGEENQVELVEELEDIEL